MTPEDIEKGIKAEQNLRKDDKYAIDTADAKNRLESAIFSAREKLDSVWKEFTRIPVEKDQMQDLCNMTEDWLYNEGSDEVKEAYDKRLADLHALTDPISKRAYEWEHVPPALAGLQQTLASFKSEVLNGGDKYSHIDKEELDKVVKKCEEAEVWLAPLLQQHATIEKTANPVFSSSDLVQRNQNVTKFCQPILSKPKPAPPPPPKEETANKEEPAPPPPPKEETANKEEPAPDDATETKSEKSDKMDTSDS